MFGLACVAALALDSVVLKFKCILILEFFLDSIQRKRFNDWKYRLDATSWEEQTVKWAVLMHAITS